jgi:hypothetical protein
MVQDENQNRMVVAITFRICGHLHDKLKEYFAAASLEGPLIIRIDEEGRLNWFCRSARISKELISL